MKKTECLDSIVSAAIHPSIGFARVGNSKDSYLVTPEIPFPGPLKQGIQRDSKGAIKRRGVRFRLYGYNKKGEPVAELTSANSKITWRVHIANKKASWFGFNYAMDIPQSVPVKIRNANIRGKNRKSLVIDPGERQIKGNKAHGKRKYRFDTGSFMGRKVDLGEIRTDQQGRLIFLGGHGVADSVYSGNFITGLGNQDGWFDDISDGPVKASLKIEGKHISVKPAWVVTAPVDFTSEFKDLVTLWDCIYDSFVQGSLMEFPAEISFLHDIYPLFSRLASYSWLNEGFNYAFGFKAPYDFHSEKYARQLSRNDLLHQEIRRQIFRRFRDPDSKLAEWDKWPWNYGDGIAPPPNDSPNQYFSITKTQYKMLQMWVDGQFIDDWDQRDTMIKENLEDFPLAMQPEILDRTSLESALGGPFRPGNELTWPMRHVTMYSEPFRVRLRDPKNPELSYGKVLTPKQALAQDGPLYYNSPGDLTRWMTIPWQLDFAACRYAYFGNDPYLPSFWAARVPNQILSEESYQIVIDESLPRQKRLEAYYKREAWYRFLDGGTFNQMNQMIYEFINQGFIERREGPKSDPDFPEVLYVEEDVMDLNQHRTASEDHHNFNFSDIIAYYQRLHEG